MSASIAELFEQIVSLELLIEEQRAFKSNTSCLEMQLNELKEKFQLMNEALSNGQSILRG